MRFIMAGGPGAGKTTVLDALAKRGYPYVPDSARLIIRGRKTRGLSPRPEAGEFASLMLKMDIESYTNQPDTTRPIFFDRGIVDSLAMLKGYISAGKIEHAINKYRYNESVFLMPPWKEIYKTDSERDQDFAHSVRVYEAVKAWYSKWGYKLTEIPRTTVIERADFIIAAMS